MTLHQNDYFLERKNIRDLSYADVLRHSAELISNDHKSSVELQPVRIEINMAQFAGVSANIAFPEVIIEQTSAGIILSCPCKTSKKTLCTHQSQVLYALMDKPYFRIFFDEKLRKDIILQTAREYGMQDDPEAASYFEVHYSNKAYEIKPVIEGLIPWNNSTANSIKDQILPLPISPQANKQASTDTQTKFVVLSRNKYYEQYQAVSYTHLTLPTSDLV